MVVRNELLLRNLPLTYGLPSTVAYRLPAEQVSCRSLHNSLSPTRNSQGLSLHGKLYFLPLTPLFFLCFFVSSLFIYFPSLPKSKM